jgi:hypothetical protein
VDHFFLIPTILQPHFELAVCVKRNTKRAANAKNLAEDQFIEDQIQQLSIRGVKSHSPLTDASILLANTNNANTFFGNFYLSKGPLQTLA